MPKYCIGPWVWDATGVKGWRAPAGTVGCVDLASLADLGSAAGSPRKAGFFAVSDAVILPSEYALLGQGDCRDIAATNAMASAWKSAAGFRPQGSKLVDLLWDHLTSGSDPDGGTACGPLVPGTDGWMDLHLGGHSRVKSARFEWGRVDSLGGNHTPKLRTLLRAEFRRHWERNQNHARRVMDMLCIQYGVADWQEFVPPDLLSHVPGRLPHATTITEDFTRADSSSAMGHLLTWTSVSGTWGTFTNQGYKSAAAGTVQGARAESDLSSANHYAQVVVSPDGNGNGSNFHGPACRYSASADTYYMTANFTGTQYVSKIVAGSKTDLGSTSLAYADNVTYKIEANGSTIKGYVGGVEKVSVTDTAITGNVRCGMSIYDTSAGTAGSNATMGSFQAADLGGGGGIVYTQLERSTRGLLRGLWTGRG